MSLLNILVRLSAEDGYDLTDVGVKTYLISKINQACEEVYETQDLPIALQELYVRVTHDFEMSLPPFVGELRAIRNGCTDYCTPHWDLHSMWPRYNKTEWMNTWNNWRVKGYSPIAIAYNNSAPGSVNIGAPDSSVTVSIKGSTITSNNKTDNIICAATTQPWISQFTQIDKISKNKTNDEDVILKDADGNEVSIIYANQLEARYIIIDVSKYPQNLWGCCNCPDGSYIMEVLYKPRLNKLVNDTDEFQVDGYEEIIILRTKQLLAELQDGKEQRAALMFAKSQDLLKNKTIDKQGTYKRSFTNKRSPYYINWDFIPYGSAQQIGNF